MESPAPANQALTASVVITTYRRTAMLAELLDALSPQLGDRAVEVVVIDNCPDASARQVVARCNDDSIRYEHESRSGVVHARNRGVAEARGTYVIFLDDDEVPIPGWLGAWLAQADGKTDASFGRIVPRFLRPCSPDLLGQITRTFSREMHRAHGADITDMSAYLGTGNAMFHKARCLGQDAPFDLRFNARGGEDVWLIRGLVRDGKRLTWNREALVEELVPADRMDLESLRLRRFNQGQLRTLLAYGNGGPTGLARALFWMLAGTVQFAGFGALALLAGLLAPSRRADLLCRASGGAGKMAWRRDAKTRTYSAD
ncbi:MAG: glycosyltransferase [Porphyrobacter sp.]|nr:glycosyltransferase [Porphyrobacter sp.]